MRARRDGGPDLVLPDTVFIPHVCGPGSKDATLSTDAGTPLKSFWNASGTVSYPASSAATRSREMQETRQRSFASPSSRHGLTDAEADVLAHLAAGLTAQSIARVRRVSPRTVLLMDR
jgi:hypothetical protein